MKNTILWSALFTLIGTQVYAEPASKAPAAPTNTAAPATAPAAAPMVMQSVAPQAPQPNQAIPTAPLTAPAPAPVINCDYKIPPQVKTVDQALVLNWAQNAVMQAFSFAPTTLDAQMEKLQACFTEQGWTGFSTALQKSGNLQAIKSQQLNVTAQIGGMTLVNEAKDNQWKLTVPIIVIYQNDKEKVSQLLSVDVTVNRKPDGDLGITQMIAAPRGSVTTKTPVQPPAVNLENQQPVGKPQ